jgi:glycosyltransferase involved in cell wall biosynthesis
MNQNAELLLELFASEFVEDARFAAALGGSKQDLQAVQRYLSLPVAARPEIAGFFDATFYRLRYPDVERAGVDPLIHYLRWGASEWRMPHPLIDPEHIIRRDPLLLRHPCTADTLDALLRDDVVDPSPFFSLAHYRRRLGAAVPPRGGLLRHFLEHGLLSGLTPCAGFDPIEYYRRMDGRDFDVRSALRRYVMASSDWASGPLAEKPPALTDARTEALLPLLGRRSLNFTHNGQAEVSVVVLCDGDAAHVLATLASLRDNFAGNIELVLADTGTQAAGRVARHVEGATWLPLAGVPSRAAIRGAALQCVSAPWIVLLEGGMELAHDALPAALRRLVSDPSIGAVGGKVMRADGRLLEAGGIIWQDGSTALYLADAQAATPEANFVRDVDFCSSCFLAVRATALQRIGDFAWEWTPDDMADAELCVRLRNFGFRVVYEPSVVIRATQANRAGNEAAAKPSATLAEWRASLQASDKPARRDTALCARSAAPEQGRILFIDDHVPLRRIGSGFVRSNDIVTTATLLGHHVTIYPMQPNRFDLIDVVADLPDTIEVMHDRHFAGLPDFLRERAGYYDTMWITRTHNLARLAPMLASSAEDLRGGARVILDTEAIATRREALRRDVLGVHAPFDEQDELRNEFASAMLCDAVVTCSRDEAQTLRRLGLPNVSVLGHRRTIRLTARPWHDRAGMLFVGAVHSADAPNLDALQWLTNEVLPLIERELGTETRLTVAGYCAPGVNLDWLRRHARIAWQGTVSDLGALYDAHRVFVAPARFAGGIPYKVHEAASFGLPVVATSLLCRQLGWKAEHDLLVADASDPAGFARHVVALHRSESLWLELRAQAAERIAVECDPRRYARVLTSILRPNASLRQGRGATAAA